MGFYDSAPVKVVRDRVAEALRVISVTINNSVEDYSVALELAKISQQISGTEGSKKRIEQELETVKTNYYASLHNEQISKVVDPIMSDIQNGRGDKALETINKLLYVGNVTEEIKKTLRELKATLEERITKYGKPIKSAPGMYTLNGCGTKLYGDTLYFVFFFVPIFPIARYSVTSAGGRSYSFQGKLPLHKWQKVWLWIVPLVILVWIISASSQ